MTEQFQNLKELPATSDVVQRARQALDGREMAVALRTAYFQTAAGARLNCSDAGAWDRAAEVAADLVTDLLGLVEVTLPTITAQRDDALAEVEKLRAAVERVRNLVVWTDPDRCGGEPCVRGTRVWVSQIVDLLEDCTDEMIAAFYPTVKPWQVSILRALDGSSS